MRMWDLSSRFDPLKTDCFLYEALFLFLSFPVFLRCDP